MRTAIRIAVASLLPMAACVVATEDAAAPIDVASEAPAVEEGGSCLKGCAVDPVPPPSADEIASLLEKVGVAAVGEASDAIEILLFHAEAVRSYVETKGTGLDPERDRHFRRELSRKHALVAMRIIDENGVVRARLDETRVPLGIKRHLKFDHYVRMQPLETNGTVVRVGLGHIWTRY